MRRHRSQNQLLLPKQVGWCPGCCQASHTALEKCCSNALGSLQSGFCPSSNPVSVLGNSEPQTSSGGAKRDQPNTKPGNWTINIYTLRLGFTHSAASGARPAAEFQVLTVLLVVVPDFQLDHNPHRLSVLGPTPGEANGCSSSQPEAPMHPALILVYLQH